MIVSASPFRGKDFSLARQSRSDLGVSVASGVAMRASGHKTEAANDQRQMTKLLQSTLGLDEKEAALLAFTAVFESIVGEGQNYSMTLGGLAYRALLIPLAFEAETLSVST